MELSNVLILLDKTKCIYNHGEYHEIDTSGILAYNSVFICCSLCRESVDKYKDVWWEPHGSYKEEMLLCYDEQYGEEK